MMSVAVLGIAGLLFALWGREALAPVGSLFRVYTPKAQVIAGVQVYMSHLIIG